MVMLPKTECDERAVSKRPTCYRVHARMPGGMIDDCNRQQIDFWDCAVRGSSALQSALLRALCFEVAGNQSFEPLAVHWDMEKLFDSVVVSMLVQLALKL
eukprot:6895151-Pyramimonas_sp.AAC.1